MYLYIGLLEIAQLFLLYSLALPAVHSIESSCSKHRENITLCVAHTLTIKSHEFK